MPHPNPCPDEVQKTLQAILVRQDEILKTLRRETRDFFTIEDLAELLGRSTYTIRRWVSEGRIRATRMSGTGPRGRLLVPYDEVVRLRERGLPAAAHVDDSRPNAQSGGE